MANKAKPNYVKSRELRVLKESLVRVAVGMYRAQTAKPGSRDWKGYRTVTRLVMEEHQRSTQNASNSRGERVDINWTTVRDRDEGTPSLLEKRLFEGLLTPEEDRILTEFLQNSADRGFPCTRKRIAEAALAIVRKRKGEHRSINPSWITRFINRKKADKQLKAYWSKALKSDRGQAVNENTHGKYFDLLEDLFATHQFATECIYGGDESSFQKGILLNEYTSFVC